MVQKPMARCDLHHTSLKRGRPAGDHPANWPRLKFGGRIAEVAGLDLLRLTGENDGRVERPAGERPFARIETINR
jgi:hypothetical protein